MNVTQKWIIYRARIRMRMKKKTRVRVTALALTLTLVFCTRSGTWTRTPIQAQDFKSGVSTIPPSEHPVWWIKKEHECSFSDSSERETGFEPATPTLARSCSTNWAILALLSSTVTKKFVVISSSRFHCIVLQWGDKDKKEIKKCNGRIKKINPLSFF